VEDDFDPFENSKGPTRFYCEISSEKNEKVLMRVKEGIVLTVFKFGRVSDTFILDKPVAGAPTCATLSPDTDEIKVLMNWKDSTFTGEESSENQISNVQIELSFNIIKKSYVLVGLEILTLKVKARTIEQPIKLHTKTKYGYAVEAPLGLSFGCTKPGMFGPKGNISDEQVSAGLTFPDVQLQIYEVKGGKFGPIWECGNLLSIGLWVCILVSLGFAVVCAYGFTMISNINTMDRFDDPKGKAIYIPQTNE